MKRVMQETNYLGNVAYQDWNSENQVINVAHQEGIQETTVINVTSQAGNSSKKKPKKR